MACAYGLLAEQSTAWLSDKSTLGGVIEEVLAVAGGRDDEADGRRVEAYS